MWICVLGERALEKKKEHIFTRINRTARICIAISYAISCRIPFTWNYDFDECNIRVSLLHKASPIAFHQLTFVLFAANASAAFATVYCDFYAANVIYFKYES